MLSNLADCSLVEVNTMQQTIQRHLLHKLKCSHNYIVEELGSLTHGYQEWCPFNHKNPADAIMCYQSDPQINQILAFLGKFYLLYDYLEVYPLFNPSLKNLIEDVKIPSENYTIKDFERNIKGLISFANQVRKPLYEKVACLTCEESDRLDEAIDCFENFCFYSTVVMAVSAVEARLHYLIKEKFPSRYRDLKLEKKTLGALLVLFEEGREISKNKRIKALIPHEHKPLLDLLNIYRVYSAHPKSKSIPPNVAKAILNLSFAFLLDPRVRLNSNYRKHMGLLKMKARKQSVRKSAT